MSPRVSQYEVSVRGDLPSNLKQKISVAHAKALQTPTTEIRNGNEAATDSKDAQSPDASNPLSG